MSVLKALAASFLAAPLIVQVGASKKDKADAEKSCPASPIPGVCDDYDYHVNRGGKAETIVRKSVSDVWAVAGNFGDYSWWPAISGTKCLSGGDCNTIGSRRGVPIGSGQVVEVLRKRECDSAMTKCMMEWGAEKPSQIGPEVTEVHTLLTISRISDGVTHVVQEAKAMPRRHRMVVVDTVMGQTMGYLGGMEALRSKLGVGPLAYVEIFFDLSGMSPAEQALLPFDKEGHVHVALGPMLGTKRVFATKLAKQAKSKTVRLPLMQSDNPVLSLDLISEQAEYSLRIATNVQLKFDDLVTGEVKTTKKCSAPFSVRYGVVARIPCEISLTFESPYDAQLYSAMPTLVFHLEQFVVDQLRTVQDKLVEVSTGMLLAARSPNASFETEAYPGMPNLPPAIKNFDGARFMNTPKQFGNMLTAIVSVAESILPAALKAKSEITQLNPWQTLLSEDLHNGKEAGFLSMVWHTDDEFTRFFLQGSSPFEMRRVTSAADIPKEFAGVKVHLDKHRYYYVEYSLLETATGTDKGAVVYPGSFVLMKEASILQAKQSKLEVVGIRLEKGGPVFTKDDSFPIRYLFAKICVLNADAQKHEFLWHLGLGHLMIEPMIAASQNTFAVKGHDDHVIYQLLKPHFSETFGINWLARNVLIPAENQALTSAIFSVNAQAGMHMVDAFLKDFKFLDVKPKRMFEAAKLASDDLPLYYYRDDALRMWGILEEYVSGVIGAVYSSDKDVADDKLVQDWAAMAKKLTPTFPGKFTTKADLVEALTAIISLPVIYHSTSNFGQTPQGLVIPSHPIYLRKGMPKDWSKGDLTHDYIDEALPDTLVSLSQVFFANFLTTPADPTLMQFAQNEGIFKVADNVSLDAHIKIRAAQRALHRSLQVFKLEIEARNKASMLTKSLGFNNLNPDVACVSTQI